MQAGGVIKPAEELTIPFKIKGEFIELEFEKERVWTLTWNHSDQKIFANIFSYATYDLLPGGNYTFLKSTNIAGSRDDEAILTYLEKQGDFKEGEIIAVNISKFWFEK